MPNHKDIYRNKVDHAREEFATEFDGNRGKPVGREAKSQKSQLKSSFTHGKEVPAQHAHGPHKEVKVKMNRKMT